MASAGRSRRAARGAAVAVNYLNNGTLADEVVRDIRDPDGSAVAVPANLSRPAEVRSLSAGGDIADVSAFLASDETRW